ncbi:TRAP transporter substrate-binding protein [Ideonella sp. 4Y11]|uniref:TRAP transporter substrate-binding protein n=1 Tax=Ideonella aquatica TaxID=2824119 RepID=A0A940YIV9_9BURK|nr:TRAP transporter substrate-binding protein [Ideonella aquatica]MBQ0957877.1 TRAP transporter substrate-binding protein [Ideonella aquatica]
MTIRLGALACAAATLLLGALPAQAQVTTIKFSHFLAPNSNFHKNVAEPWCAAIEKDSGGKLKCQLYPALQLGGTPPQLADQVKNGVADVVWTSPSYSTGRFPRTEALELPFSLPPGGLAGSKAMWEYYQKHGQEDFKDFKVLAIFSASNVVMSTASKPILTVDGFKGVKLRSPSRFSSLFLTALGGTPVNMPIAQVTESVSKGVIDGAMAPWEVLPATKIDEVTKYHMEGQPNQPGFTQTPMAVLMNKAKFESLPADLKAVIDKHSGAALVELTGKVWDTGNDEARKKMTAQGNKVLVIKDADYAAMKTAAASVEADWIKQATAKGLDGKKLAAEVHAIGAKYMSK